MNPTPVLGVLDSPAKAAKNVAVAKTNAIGIGVPNHIGGQAAPAAIFLSVRMVTPSMGGPCGAAKAAPVPMYRYANPHGSAHPDWRRGRREKQPATSEAIMPKSLSRALRVLFPLQAHHISTVPTQAEARALAVLLVSRGKRAVIYPASQGFAVSEVTL